MTIALTMLMLTLARAVLSVSLKSSFGLHESRVPVNEVPPTPWRRAQRFRRSEREAAKAEGGTVQPASGALRRARSKGDVRVPGILIEDKVTDKQSFTIKETDLAKTISQAIMQGVTPHWRITIGNRRFRLMQEDDYLYLAARAGDNGKS